MLLSTDARAKQTWVMIIGSLFILALALIIYYFVVLRRGWGWLGLAPLITGWKDALWLFIGGAGGLTLLLGFLKLVPLKHYYSPEIALIAEEYSFPALTLMYLVNGFAEELLFRGALQPWLGILPAAILFTLVHFSYYKRPLMMLYVLCSGLWLGLIYHWSGSVWVCTLAHAAMNYAITWLIKTKRIHYAPPLESQ